MAEGAVSDEALKKAESFIEEEEGAANHLAGALGLSLLISLLFAGWLMQKLIDRQARREERP